ncbi:acyl-ACP--UDP-N- acetylglucosamine O-acyltransferase [Glaciibacter sp. 2TAF33]|uniref:acyl-ACP--UDP-N- acetylglucosamine O-acyltransferase n=1 Tax=Glaciibacter sp. 2TAF33 TaxID=3233015 RepID=UPI003F93C40E
MNHVHPTAIIGPHVTVGTGNVIGPYAVIGGNVVIGDDNWIGAGVKIGCPPEVRGFPHPQDWIASGVGPGVTLGDRNVLREDVQVHGGWHEPTMLANDLFIMNRVYVAHDCSLADGVTLASGVALGGHVKIGRGANLGLGTTVHQRRVVGALAMVGMSSVVTRDIPPFSKAYGSPCRADGINSVGLERAGISRSTVEEITRLASHAGYPGTAANIADMQADVAWFQGAIV